MTRLFLSSLLLFGLSGVAGAALLARENFEDELTGGLNGQGAGADGGFTGTWSADAQASVVSTTLSYTNGDVTSLGGSQALELTFANADIVGNLFSRSFTPIINGTVYLSFLYRETTNPAFGTDFIQVGFEDTDPDQPRASIMRRNGEYQVRAGTSSPGTSTVGSGVSADTGVTHLFVMKAEKTGAGNYNRISLFVDPSSLTEPGSASAVVNADTGRANFGLLTARSAFHATGDSFQLDNLRIGESWEDVVVPEPGTAGLALLGSTLLLRRRRNGSH